MKEDDRKATQYKGESKSDADTIKIQERFLLQQAIENRDKGAIRQVNTIYYLNIKRYIASRVDSIEDIEDLTQSVFLEFFEKTNDIYKQYRSIEACLQKIAKDRVALYYRNQNKQIPTIPIDSVDELSIINEIPQYEIAKSKLSLQERKIVRVLINQLPPKAQEAVRLRFLEGLSPKHAAKKSGCSTNTFYQRTIAGIKAIRKLKEQSSPVK